MKVLKKIKKDNGRRNIYFLGIKIFSYKKMSKALMFDKIYAKRFDGLNRKEIRFILEQQFKKMVGYKLNIGNPRTYNEKIQWIKYYHHNPLMTICADKVAVRDYIKEKVGEEYLVPAIGVYEKVEDIDWDKLPNKFVAKVNWGSGYNIICQDKTKLDINDAKNKLAHWMKPKSNYYYIFLEWAYKNIKPKIIIEQYIESKKVLKDYKFYCFNGEAKYLLVSEGHSSPNEDFYDICNNLQFCNFTKGGEISGNTLKIPHSFNKMKEIATALASSFSHVRVDFYENIDGKPLLGELTFTPGNGTSKFEPIEWDYKWGEMLKLPERMEDE